jgi:hypothetical protein
MEMRGTVEGNPCAFVLKEPPASTDDLWVFIEGEQLQSGPDSWVYGMVQGAPTVTFQGSLCSRVMRATPENPVSVKLQSGS